MKKGDARKQNKTKTTTTTTLLPHLVVEQPAEILEVLVLEVLLAEGNDPVPELADSDGADLLVDVAVAVDDDAGEDVFQLQRRLLHELLVLRNLLLHGLGLAALLLARAATCLGGQLFLVGGEGGREGGGG